MALENTSPGHGFVPVILTDHIKSFRSGFVHLTQNLILQRCSMVRWILTRTLCTFISGSINIFQRFKSNPFSQITWHASHQFSSLLIKKNQFIYLMDKPCMYSKWFCILYKILIARRLRSSKINHPKFSYIKIIIFGCTVGLKSGPSGWNMVIVTIKY